MAKIKKLALGALILLLTTSCVARRLDYLERRKALIDNPSQKISASHEIIYPEDVRKFSVDEYLAWYKGLEAPPVLKLTDYEKPKKLSQADMVSDFNFLFEELKANYPFFGVLKRNHGIDFLGNYDDYLARIKACESDEDFERTIEEILSDLKNYHARLRDRDYVKSTLAYFSKNWNQPSIYYEFLTLNTKAVRDRYQLDGLQTRTNSGAIDRQKSKVFKDEKKSNLTLEVQNDLAILKIRQMTGESVSKVDEEVLEDFLRNKHMYKGLVIDIRDNVGGNMNYWQNFLLPRLLTKPKQVTNHMFFKDSARGKLMLSDDTLNVERLSNVDISGIKLDHAEDLENFAYYMKDVINISPDEGDRNNGYEGPIYLLVDEDVFSASEGLASFMKHSQSARLVGTQTGGDGITLGVINSSLPRSGLVYTYTNTLGYAPDGTINEEDPTMPDIETESLRDAMEIIKKDI